MGDEAQAAPRCAPALVKSGALLYPKCRAGFKGVGPVCWQRCRPGYLDDGATCRRNARIIRANNRACPWYDKCGVGAYYWKHKRRCSTCPPGYRNDGCTCRINAHIYGKKSYGRGVGKIPPRKKKAVATKPALPPAKDWEGMAIRVNADHAGGDYYAVRNTRNWVLCARLCRLLEGDACRAFSFSPKAHTCYLKYRVMPGRPLVGIVTGHKAGFPRAPRVPGSCTVQSGIAKCRRPTGGFRSAKLVSSDECARDITVDREGLTQCMRIEPGLDHVGNDYLQKRKANWHECSRLCEGDAACKAFTFNRQARRCTLKNKYTGSSRHVGGGFMVAGVKKTGGGGDIQICTTDVDAKFARMKPRPAQVLRAAALKVCRITGSSRSALAYLEPTGNPAAGKLGKFERLFGRLVRPTEPSLFRLAGAKRVLRDLLVAEATALWSEAKKAEARAEGGSSTFAARRVAAPPRSNRTKRRAQTPGPAPSATTPTVFLAPGGLVQGTTVSMTGPGGTGEPPITPQGYADAVIALLPTTYPSAMVLRTRMYTKLVELARKSLRVPHEEAFVRSMEAFLKKEYIGLAQDALQQYYAWKKQDDRRRSFRNATNKLSHLIDIGTVPPKFEDAAKKYIALGIAAAATVATATVAAAALGTAPVFLATAVGAATAGTAVTAGSIAAAALGPAGAIVAGLIMVGVAISSAVKIFTAEKKLKKAIAKARTTKVDLFCKVATQAGKDEVLFFFSKATAP